jgi:membrane protein
VSAAERTPEKPPDGPEDLGRRRWLGVLKRTGKEFNDDALTDWAAALTYYGVLAIFPALLALVSIVGLLGESTAQSLLDNLETATPGPANDIVVNTINGLQRSQGTAGIMFVVGIAGAIWSASGYVGAFMRASNHIYDMGEGRPIYKTLPTRVGLTVAMLALLTIAAVGVVVTGGLAHDVGDVVGVGDTAVMIWDIAKWPVLLLAVSTMISLLYWGAPNVKQPGFKWITPGSMLAVLTWVATSALFALYVANFSSYNKTYGALGGVIAFLTWLWISNIAILFGAELNAELDRARRQEAGQPTEPEPFVEPRDTAKLSDGERSDLAASSSRSSP